MKRVARRPSSVGTPKTHRARRTTIDERRTVAPAFVNPLLEALKHHKGGDNVPAKTVLARAKTLADKAEELRQKHQASARKEIEVLLRNKAPLTDDAKAFMRSLASEVKRRREASAIKPEHWEGELSALLHRIPPGWLKVHMREILKPTDALPELLWDEDRVLLHAPPKTVEAFYDCMLLENQLLPWRIERGSLSMHAMNQMLRNAEETMERLCGRLPHLSAQEMRHLESCLREVHEPL